MTASTPLAQQVALLEKKRTILAGLCQLVIALEQLHASLEAALLLGGNQQALSAAELQALEVIRQRVRGLDNAELKQAIAQLDERVHDELHNLIRIALQLVDDPHASLAQLETLNPQANAFNRNARTAIALRSLLAQRGEPLEPLNLPLPKQEIEARLQQVEAHEQDIRQQVSTHVEGMRADIAQMLAYPACSEAQREMFKAMDRALADNLAHIAAGRSLSELPMPIDNIHVEPAAKQATNGQAPADTGKTIEPEDSTLPEQEAASLPATPPPSLWQRLWAWLNSPWNAGWKSHDKRRD